MLISFARVIGFGVKNFFRNFWLSFATLTILFLSLSTINALVIVNVIAQEAITQVEEKIDITVYFRPEVSEEQVKNLELYVSALDAVDSVTYVSKDQALIAFKEKHKDNDKILGTLEELGNNPLGATLIVQALDTSKYQTILEALEGKQYNELIESKDFDDHRILIERISQITTKVAFAVMLMVVAFGIISVLIVFNTIRVAIYTYREEIKIMSLVGASKSFILGPFMVESFLFSIISVLISIVVVYPVLGLVQPYIETVFDSANFNIITYYNTNFASIFGLQFLFVAFVCIVATFLASRKYAKA